MKTSFSKNNLKKIAKILLVGFLLFLGIDLIFPFEINPNYSQSIVDSKGEVIHSFLNDEDKWRLKMELFEMTSSLKKAFIDKEDRWFYFHFGFNPISILRAGFQNIFYRRRTSGASTITMQVVRLLEPKKRTYFNKIIEIFNAIQLEWHYSKEEILQLYVNLVPYGSNIEGVKAASLIYFEKNPDRLSLAEVVSLAIIPNRPSSLKIGINNEKIITERNKWLKKYEKLKTFELSNIKDAITEPLTAKRHKIPDFAPHFANRLRSNMASEVRIETYIDAGHQKNTEEITRNYMNRMKAMTIHNASILVINNKTNAIEVYVGSSDFMDSEAAGQVDGIRAIRSPGSTLKPLLYGLAFDRGIITPKSILNDVPINFGGYEPENFDQDFHGKVSITYALANSLNIPAVKILDEIGKYSLTDALKKADFKAIKKNEKSLGLSLILGGCGVSLEELTQLFASFANKGVYQKAKIWKSDLINSSKMRILSEEANYLVTDILSQITRPDLPNNYQYTYRLPKIAWKTGTSFGKKDAWSIGYNKNYTIGVWVGNFSGVGVPELSGANIATPLLFEIFNAIDSDNSKNWFQPAKGLEKRFVCAESGNLPSGNCKNQVIDYFIPGVSNVRICNHVKPIKVDLKHQYAYCTRCLPDENFETELFENYAPELIGFYESKHILYQKPLPHNPDCDRIFDDSPPKITFPLDKATYFIDKKEKQTLLLSCQTRADVKSIFWYVNDQFIKKATPNEAITIFPSAGKIKISCTDDRGRTSNIAIKIKWI